METVFIAIALAMIFIVTVLGWLIGLAVIFEKFGWTVPKKGKKEIIPKNTVIVYCASCNSSKFDTLHKKCLKCGKYNFVHVATSQEKLDMQSLFEKEFTKKAKDRIIQEYIEERQKLSIDEYLTEVKKEVKGCVKNSLKGEGMISRKCLIDLKVSMYDSHSGCTEGYVVEDSEHVFNY